MTPATLLWMALAVPLTGALLITAAGRWPNLREAITLLTAGALFAVVLQLWPVIQDGSRPLLHIAEIMPQLRLALHVEPLGLIFALLASFLWIVTSIYAIGYMRAHHEENQTRFYAFFAIAIAATMGVALAANMFTLFIFYEILTLSTYPLVTHAGTEEARRGGRVYLGILLGTSIGLQLLAILWTWTETHNLSFQSGGVFDAHTPGWLIATLYALFVFGIGKAALMPFHRWLPAAMVAPTPVSALLHAVAVVKAGVFAVLKITVYLFGIDTLQRVGATEWLLYVAGATILLASLVAMRKDNLKARLAYSTISQLGYVVLGALLATSWGIIGGALHIVMHAFGKITLFFCAGAILVAAHKTEISDMRGLGHAMPYTFAAFFIASLSIIGLPPLGGLWSKWFLALGTLQAGQLWLLAVLMISSLLNIAYLLPIPVRAFMHTDKQGLAHNGIHEAPWPCLLAISITTLGSIALFFYPEPFYQLAQMLIAGG